MKPVREMAREIRGRTRKREATYLARPRGAKNVNDLSRFNLCIFVSSFILFLQGGDPLIPTFLERFHCHRADKMIVCCVK